MSYPVKTRRSAPQQFGFGTVVQYISHFASPKCERFGRYFRKQSGSRLVRMQRTTPSLCGPLTALCIARCASPKCRLLSLLAEITHKPSGKNANTINTASVATESWLNRIPIFSRHELNGLRYQRRAAFHRGRMRRDHTLPMWPWKGHLMSCPLFESQSRTVWSVVGTTRNNLLPIWRK